MKKVKLLMILMCVLMCLGGCTFNSDTIATITGNEAVKTKTTCRLKTNDNILTKIVLQHNNEEINDEFVEGELVFLNYSASRDASIEEKKAIRAVINEKYPIKDEYLFGHTNFTEDTEYGNKAVAARNIYLGYFNTIRNNESNSEFLKLTPELLSKETMTYSDLVTHLESLGYECK